jgi:hypothetical protein
VVERTSLISPYADLVALSQLDAAVSFNARGFSLKEIAAFAWAPFVAAGLGAL